MYPGLFMALFRCSAVILNRFSIILWNAITFLILYPQFKE
jgi:hypothetical protein